MTRAAAGLACAGIALCSVVAGGGGFTAEAAALFQLAALASAGFAASLPARPGPPGAGAAGLALAGIALLSAGLAPYRFASLDRWGLWAAALLLAWSVSRLARAADSPEDGRRRCAKLVLAASSAVVLIQLAGEAGWHPLGTAGAITVRGLMGSFGSPNHLAELLVVMALLCASLASGSDRLGRALGLLAAVAALGVATGTSRIAPVALATGFAAWVVASGRLRKLPRAAWLLAALFLVVLAGVSIRTIALRAGEPDGWRRPQIWASVAPAALERPLLGLGPGSYRHAHHPYNFPVESRIARFGSQARTPHGEWLRLPIELGLLGCAALLLLVVLRLRGGHARGAWPLLAALAPLALVHDCFHPPAVAAWFAVAFVVTSQGRRDAAQAPALLRADDPPRLLAVALLAAVAVAGLVLRPTLADRAARRGSLGASLAWNPSHPLRWLEAAELSSGRGDPAGVAATLLCLDEAARLAPRWPEPPREQARLLADAARRFRPEAASRDAAAASWERAARNAPFDPFLLVEPAVLLAQTGDPARALRLAESALELEPRCTDAALVALLATRRLGLDEAAARRRAEEALSAAAGLRERATSDYETRLVTPDEQLLAASGLRGRSRR